MNPSLTRRKFISLIGGAACGLNVGLSRLMGATNSSNARSSADEADRLLAAQTRGSNVTSATLLIRQGSFEFIRAYGRAKIETPFLIASPTKPMTVSAVMWL